jgi:hypothetical protein
LPTRHDGNPQSKVASWCRQRKLMEDPTTFKPPGTIEVLMVRQCNDVPKQGQPLPRLEILEGLSSNFFVIDKNGSLRTATDGILHGYVRHLVMECTSSNSCCSSSSSTTLRIPFDPRPIFLDNVDEWAEAFITSSSRLIIPITKILLPIQQPKDNYQSNNKNNNKTHHDADNGITLTDTARTDIFNNTKVGNYHNHNMTFVEYWYDPYLCHDDLRQINDQDNNDGKLFDEHCPKWQQILNEILAVGGYHNL